MKRWMGAVAVCLAALGCSSVEPAPFPEPSDPAGQQAAAILRSCESEDGERELSCHEEAVLEVLDTRGVAEAMAVAERMGDLDAEVRREGHVYAHAIGLAAYTGPEEVGEVFASCTASYQSGCYHGVIQSYFVDLMDGDRGQVTPEAVNALCEGQRGENGSLWLLFQCAHGIGHGVTMLYGYELPAALEACDAIESDWERHACYGGAFMENLVQATAPHHTVGRPGTSGHHAGAPGHGAHGGGGHAHGGDAHAGHESSETGPSFPPLDPEDPLYPCTVLEDRYLPACYHMQTSAVLFFNGGDFEAAADACRGAPEAYQRACFQSIGRDVSALTVQDHDQALELCALTADREYDCHWGYVKNVVDVTADAEAGFQFCRAIPDAEGRSLCFEAVGEQVWVLANDSAARERLCQAADVAFRDACRRGAGLADAGPSRGGAPEPPARTR